MHGHRTIGIVAGRLSLLATLLFAGGCALSDDSVKRSLIDDVRSDCIAIGGMGWTAATCESFASCVGELRIADLRAVADLAQPSELTRTTQQVVGRCVSSARAGP